MERKSGYIHSPFPSYIRTYEKSKDMTQCTAELVGCLEPREEEQESIQVLFTLSDGMGIYFSYFSSKAHVKERMLVEELRVHNR